MSNTSNTTNLVTFQAIADAAVDSGSKRYVHTEPVSPEFRREFINWYSNDQVNGYPATRVYITFGKKPKVVPPKVAPKVEEPTNKEIIGAVYLADQPEWASRLTIAEFAKEDGCTLLLEIPGMDDVVDLSNLDWENNRDSATSTILGLMKQHNQAYLCKFYEEDAEFEEYTEALKLTTIPKWVSKAVKDLRAKGATTIVLSEDRANIWKKSVKGLNLNIKVKVKN